MPEGDGQRVLITGVAGQDGYYLADLLLKQGHRVWGVVRPGGSRPTDLPDVELVEADLGDADAITALIRRLSPDRLYNLAGFSRPQLSFDQPLAAARTNALGVLHLLEAVRHHAPACRFLQAGTSEMFGDPPHSPQNETTPFCPRNPYGAAKVHAHWLVVAYRRQFGLFAANGIFYNHESERRSSDFVSRKITRGAARIKLGLDDRLALGNLEARRDWSFAGDVVQALQLIVEHEVPEDFVVASGTARPVADMCQAAFAAVGLDWRQYVDVDPRWYRAEDGPVHCGDPSKARQVLGWQPEVGFAEMIQRMVQRDVEILAAERRVE